MTQKSNKIPGRGVMAEGLNPQTAHTKGVTDPEAVMRSNIFGCCSGSTSNCETSSVEDLKVSLLTMHTFCKADILSAPPHRTPRARDGTPID